MLDGIAAKSSARRPTCRETPCCASAALLRIAQQLPHAFGIEIDKDVVRRVLAEHDRRGDSGTTGPSWPTFIGHVKDSLWSVDLFRCESILLRSHWVLPVIDVFTAASSVLASNAHTSTASAYVGCSITPSLEKPSPRHLSTDQDPLFRFHRTFGPFT